MFGHTGLTVCVSPQDRSADFSTGNSVGQKNRIFATLVMGVYEVGGMGVYTVV